MKATGEGKVKGSAGGSAAQPGKAGEVRTPPASGNRKPGAAQPPGEEGQSERQGSGRQRLEPQDQPPAGVKDDANIAGEKDFELKPPGGA